MLTPVQLYYINQHLCQILARPTMPFGGITVVLCGDPGQLTPVKPSYCLWEDDRLGLQSVVIVMVLVVLIQYI